MEENVDLVDIFLRSDRIGPIFDEAIELHTRGQFTGALWTQIGIRDEAATVKARSRGIRVIESRCPVIEIPRLCIPTPKGPKSKL